MEGRIELVGLATVQRWPRNPKQHDGGAIEASFDRHGFVEPMIRDERSGRLVAGHGRLEVLLARKAAGGAPPARIEVREGEWFVPVLCGLEFANEAEAEAYLLADNRLVEKGGWDQARLKEFLWQQLAQDSMKGTGYDVGAAQRILGQDAPPGAAPTANPEDPGGIRQVSFQFDAPTFEKVVERLDRAMKDTGTDNHTDAFMALGRAYAAAD